MGTSDRWIDGRPTTKVELDKDNFLLDGCGIGCSKILIIQDVVGWTVLSGRSCRLFDPLKNLIMQQHLLSPALPPSPTDILQPSPSRPLVSSAYQEPAMTTTITTATVKRKRSDIPDSASATKPVVKKKKANRACIHCQKAHLTCDDCSCSFPTNRANFSSELNNFPGFFFSLVARPCQRCIKRGMPNDCVEGHRKKAKYLLDDEELGPYSLSIQLTNW